MTIPGAPPFRALIVNADDFGLSPGVNAGVLAAHRDGLVTSATLMANMPDAAAAVATAPPTLALGLHLNLTSGEPCAGAARVPTLVDGSGRFLSFGRLMGTLSLGRVQRGHLEREIAAQLERALALGARLDHLDGHHHVHLHPAVRPIALRLAAAYRVGAVRCPVEAAPGLGGERAGDRARRLAIGAWARRLRRHVAAAGLRTTDHFRGLALGLAFDTPALMTLLRHLPSGLTELMVHPGNPDAALRQRTSYADGRNCELAALTAPAAVDLVRTCGIRLTSYREAMAELGPD
ncbi:MAG TPA: ChbG/HpnK family deacetylase [Chloroflexota bacterium]|jgi:hopanoid biosynthesis associated protein HpnK